MSKKAENEQVVWTPQMPDRRKDNRRNTVRDIQMNGKPLNISHLKYDGNRRMGSDRRKKITLVITGRAMDA